MTLVPLNEKVIIKQSEAEEKIGKVLFAPENAKEKPKKGKVVAVGQGYLLQNGAVVPLPVQVGDIVFFASYGSSELEVDGEKYLIMPCNDILSILKD